MPYGKQKIERGRIKFSVSRSSNHNVYFWNQTELFNNQSSIKWVMTISMRMAGRKVGVEIYHFYHMKMLGQFYSSIVEAINGMN